MDMMEIREEYLQALKQGQREAKSSGNAHPAVLDAILEDSDAHTMLDIGTIEIPIQRIVGVKSAGRTGALSKNFLPLMDVNSEFAAKWMHLCAAHLTEGIRDPITCYEYLGNFYVQEGNKRVSVLRYYGAPSITGTVKRVLPHQSDEPHIKAYFEFTEFYKYTRLYDIQFRQPGDFHKLLAYLGKEPDQVWTEQEHRRFRSYFYYFRQTFAKLGGEKLDLLPGEGLLLWLRVYPFSDLGELSSADLLKSMRALWGDMISISQEEPVQVHTEPPKESKGHLISKLIGLGPDHVNVAFVHPRDLSTSPWVVGHETGAAYMKQALADAVTVRSYFHADSQEQAAQILDHAVEEGAQVVFTTSPQLSRATLIAAVKHPKVKFLNCSVNAPYSSVRTYYSRIFEGKFITGAIAGAMSDNNHIGYVGSYPIFGVPASINAFALGAQLTNPRAKIDLRWSCMAGSPEADFIAKGIQVISNRDMPTPDKMYLDYGTYRITEQGMEPLGSPIWMWGNFYQQVVQSVLHGTWENAAGQAVNYWWGMDSGVIDVKLPDTLPNGVRFMAELLRQGLQKGTIDPFARRIVAQDGTVKNTGEVGFSPEELLHMDWLCENVEGSIPSFDQIQPFSQAMVRELGVYRDLIPVETEVTP